MYMLVGLVVAAVAILAFANGANDNFKGVATIYGSGTAGYRLSLAWATVATLAGSALTPVLAAGLIQTFRARGLVPDDVATAPPFLSAAALAAAITVLVATRFGFPVSTTHALTGGLVGASIVAAGDRLDPSVLYRGFLAPLMISPLLAVVVVIAIHVVVRRVLASPLFPVLLPASQRVIAAGHFLSAGAVCFARGLNDTPKILAITLAAQIGGDAWLLTGVALAIAAGGVLGARRVAETVAKKITPLDPGEGLMANAGTAGLVIAASVWRLPVSTTHVSTGCIFGVGLMRGTARWRVLTGILVAWLTTLPLAAMLGAIFYAAIARLA